LTPIITPKAGLGANPVNDLNAFYGLINVRLEYDEGGGDFTTANNFRQIGIIMNPEKYGGGSLTDTTADATYKLTMPLLETYNYTIDSVIKNVTLDTMATVVDWTPPVGSTKGVLRVVMNQPSDVSTYSYAAGFYTGDTIEVIGTGHQSVIDTVAASPTEVQPYSGDIIYFENRKAIQRDISQIEDIHLAFEF